MQIDPRLIIIGRSPGSDPRGLQRAQQRGALVRIRPGAYIARRDWELVNPRERFALRTHALVATVPEAVLSHRSAAVAHGLPLIGPMPERPEVVERRTVRSRSTAAVLRHTSSGTVDVVRVGAALATPIGRTLVDLAATSPFRFALAPLDEALRRGWSREALSAELDAAAPRAHRRAQLAISWADGHAANAGESTSRATLLELGFPAPLLQVPAIGTPYATDFGWPRWRRRGEFDGLEKYRAAEFRKGRTPAEVVIDEKLREDAIRAATGDAFIRWIWSDVMRVEPLRLAMLRAGIPQGRWRAQPRAIE
ncbi:hypothetical protein [Arenivirga flava]|uniref:Transcriptional regulator, AbiEi antitoxin, Type IV TA system n=1 Tax=Arenivirga flava TaxID=1930060 RepID=A0AA37UJN0_9MICO|nr:hypothetical protein [Arenivirga flava]GMA26781.1 hypothetical protein GCM10025874_00340 [Arenivirga flava]GMA29896.1 hypothetical protein GCM10025874_31490 [Arenivirga flava]GMA29975.1 hypothetical protein GCM10025874_32280 [Arenivirga flava]